MVTDLDHLSLPEIQAILTRANILTAKAIQDRPRYDGSEFAFCYSKALRQLEIFEQIALSARNEKRRQEDGMWTPKGRRSK